MSMRALRILVFGVVAVIGAQASAAIIVNEVSGSTSGADYEFIELFNNGGSAVNLTGWTIELWESDNAALAIPGAQDGGAPYPLTAPGKTTILPSGFGLLANGTAEGQFGVTADVPIQENAIENSSYTMLIRDDLGSLIQSIFVTDGGADDAANDGTSLITPDYTVGPDGSFIPGAFVYNSNTDSYDIIPFGDIASQATPTPGLVPEPTSVVLMLLAGVGLMGIGRRLSR